MTLRNQVLAWVGICLLAILTLWLFRSILLPFVIGIALAYLLNPLVSTLQRLGISRGLGTATVLLVVVSIIIGLFVLVVPLLVDQIFGLLARLPRYVADLQALAEDIVPQVAAWLGPERSAQLQASVGEVIANATGMIGALTATIAASGATLLNMVAIIIVTPVVAFYTLMDWDKMVRGLDDLLPRSHRSEIKSVLAEIDRSMHGVLRGQGSVILILAAFYATALTLAGLNFGLAIGLIGGLFSFVPFLGFALGIVLSVGVAIVQFWPNYWMVLVIISIYLIGQFIEGNILYPKLVGSSININPVWLMFALLAFGLIFGFVGLLLAVPLAAIAGVLTRYAVKKYKASSLYSGTAQHQPALITPAKATRAPGGQA
ncbi:MAG: AI-2E family transporter [Devosia sp.]